MLWISLDPQNHLGPEIQNQPIPQGQNLVLWIQPVPQNRTGPRHQNQLVLIIPLDAQNQLGSEIQNQLDPQHQLRPDSQNLVPLTLLDRQNRPGPEN